MQFHSLILFVKCLIFPINNPFYPSLIQYHLLVSDESYPHIVFVDKGQTENALIEESSVVETQNYDSEGPFYIITILLSG